EVTSTGAPNPSNFADDDGDKCGDIDSTHNPQFVHLTGIQIPCVAAPNTNPPQVNLPNCTSWRQPGSNEVCNVPFDAYPGSPSKCNCQPNFPIGIFLEHPTIGVTKSANPTSFEEPGPTPVTYTVHVTNKGTTASVTITTLTDTIPNPGGTTTTFTGSN